MRKAGDVFRVLILGDSRKAGILVNDNRTLPWFPGWDKLWNPDPVKGKALTRTQCVLRRKQNISEPGETPGIS